MNEGIPIKRNVSEKEVALVQALANDKKPKDIAKERKVTHKLVEYEIDILKKAYGCRGYVGLIVLFFRNNLIK